MPRNLPVILILSAFLLSAAVSADGLQERSWSLVDGSRVQGTLESPEPGAATVRVVSRTASYELRLADLSPEDRQYVRSVIREREAATEQAAPAEPAAEITVVAGEDFNTPGASAGDRRTLIVNNVEYRFCWCPPGTFMMGSPAEEPDHEFYETQHEVTLSRGFWILESEVTQQFWRMVTGRTVKDELTLYQPNVGGVFEVDEIKKVDRLGYGNDYPVYFISWTEAADFCRVLTEKSGLSVSLPTEAQWEYACRAGTLGPFATMQIKETVLDSSGRETFRISMTDPSDMCWYIDNSGDGLHPVKQRQPNAWGIYDMHGNVWEMCADRYSKDYYSGSPAIDPAGASAGDYRVIRGGCWFSYLKFCRSACRYRNTEDYRYNNLGFRIVINPNP